MSSPPPLQCLFCNHLNPAGASFCNDCGSQMHLQPCDRCGAINKRTARNCYKCDAGFTLPAAAEPAHSPPQPPPAYEIVSSKSAVTATGSRRTWRFAVPAILLAAMAAAVYYHFEPSVPLAKRPGVTPIPASAVPPTLAAQAEAASAPTGTTPKLAAGTSGLDEALSLAPPAAGAAMTARRSPAPAAEVTTRQDSAILTECPEAVAALGLCNPGTKQEKP